MATDGYVPVYHTWAAGEWSTGAFVIAILLIFLFGLRLLILGYLLVVKPPGTLTVTYELRTNNDDEDVSQVRGKS